MEEKRVVTLDRYEYGIILNSLNYFRNSLIQVDEPTEDVDDLLIKISEIPTKKKLFEKKKNNETR